MDLPLTTNNKKKAIFCWSGGKDSALALYKILSSEEYEIVALLTTLNEEFKRVSMHGVREDLLEEQAKSIGIPLVKMWVPKTSTNEEYERRMASILLGFKKQGVEFAIFGDIFLEDLRRYREGNLSNLGMKAIFPLWKIDTKQLLNEFFDLDFGTVICCTNNDFFDDQTVGSELTPGLIKAFPSNVDVCGENGEFHSYAFKGPIFKYPIPYKVGEKVLKTYEAKCTINSKEQIEVKGFWFVDLLLDQ
jgi:uncharacterized protein (TIGR00290 family)